MQTQQRTPLSNHETRDETNVSSAYSLNSTKRLRYHVNFWEGSSMQPELSNRTAVPEYVRTREISSWPEVEDWREAHEGRTETGCM